MMAATAATKSITSRISSSVFICDLPLSKTQELCDHLDALGIWMQLAKQMGFNDEDIKVSKNIMDLNDGDIKLCSMFVCNMLTDFLRVFPRNSIQKYCVEISKKKFMLNFMKLR